MCLRMRPPQRLQMLNFDCFMLFLRGRYDTGHLDGPENRDRWGWRRRARPISRDGVEGSIIPDRPPHRPEILEGALASLRLGRQDRQPLHAQVQPEQGPGRRRR